MMTLRVADFQLHNGKSDKVSV